MDDARTAGLVVMGVGMRPENALAVAAGLEVGPRRGVRTNECLWTTDPHIFAAGDTVETDEFGTGERTQVPLAGPANRQGRITADNALGRKSKYRGTQGKAVIRLFGSTVAVTDLSEKGLKREWRPYVHPTHHAGYCSGAEGMLLNLLCDLTSGNLSALRAAGVGADKRIDVLAVAVQAGMKVVDLEDMELCYAPQLGSAKNSVNMVCVVAAGSLRGDRPQIDWESVAAADRPFLLDVRTPQEFADSHIPGSVNVSVDDLRRRLGEFPKARRRVLPGWPAGESRPASWCKPG